MSDRYRWQGGEETMLRFGPPDGPIVVIAPPLFEEANRLRAFIVAICRALSRRGVASALPDLPGQGESLVPTAAVSLHDWRTAFAAAAGGLDRPVHVATLRGGALVDGAADALSRYRFSPVTGEVLVGEMLRAACVAALPKKIDFRLHEVPDGPPITLLGTPIGRRTLLALQAAEPADGGMVRTVRLDGDRAAANRHVRGASLWRRAEPGNDPALAELLAEDIADWIAACAG